MNLLNLPGGARISVRHRGSTAIWSDPIVLVGAFGAIGVIGFAASRDRFFLAAATGLIVAGASLVVGALLGFLFGIPRAVQTSGSSDDKISHSQTNYLVNTNLEQISDWLTKIIVGLGLVELRQIPPTFAELCQSVASAFGVPQVSNGFVGAVLLYFAVTGFLGTYLWTRLSLTVAFSRVAATALESPEFAEGLIQALLYQPPPGGFTEAINEGEAFVKEYGSSNWRVWRSLACAYAQSFGYLKASNAPADKIESARESALGAIRSILAINPLERPGLRAMWDPNIATPEENDLTVFYSDAEFAELLNPPVAGEHAES